MKLSDVLSRSTLAAAACWAFAAADAFLFHRFTPDIELTVFYAGLGAMGVGGAYSVGLRMPAPPA